MVRKQVLQAHEHSGQSLLEKVKSKSNQKKLLSTFSKLHISLTPDQEHKKGYFVVGFCNGETLKDHLVKAKLSNDEITGKSDSCQKG